MIPQSRSPLLLFGLISGLLLSSAGCGQQEDQRTFEREAFSSPSEFTETQNGVDMISRDDDDWRVAPFFQGMVRVSEAAFPNPVLSSETVSINLSVDGTEYVNGLETAVYHGDGILVPLDMDERSPLPVGQVTIRFGASELGRFDDPVGLHRVIVFDRNGQVITYGDIQVE